MMCVRWLAVFTALANWLLGMVTGLIGNIITSPPWSVDCLLFWRAGSPAGSVADYSQWPINWYFHWPVSWMFSSSSDQLTDHDTKWLTGSLACCLVGWLVSQFSRQPVSQCVHRKKKSIQRNVSTARQSNNQSAICLATKLFSHSCIHSVSKSVIQSYI